MECPNCNKIISYIPPGDYICVACRQWLDAWGVSTIHMSCPYCGTIGRFSPEAHVAGMIAKHTCPGPWLLESPPCATVQTDKQDNE